MFGVHDPLPPSVYSLATQVFSRAGSYLGWLTGHALPRVEAALNAPPADTAIASYSLGGLFALYALHKSDAFSRAASAS